MDGTGYVCKGHGPSDITILLLISSFFSLLSFLSFLIVYLTQVYTSVQTHIILLDNRRLDQRGEFKHLSLPSPRDLRRKVGCIFPFLLHLLLLLRFTPLNTSNISPLPFYLTFPLHESLSLLLHLSFQCRSFPIPAYFPMKY